MLKQILRGKWIAQFLVLLLTLAFVTEPVYAQAGRYRQLPQDNVNTGESFRTGGQGQEGVQVPGFDQMQGAGGAMDMMQKGAGGSMMQLTYQVHVLGEVKKPGTYRVMASERLAEVLQRSGGVAEQGSRRRIQIKRDGRVVKTVDLVKFELYGQLDNNPYLLDNDVVFVPLREKTVQIVGAVKRPDTYEIVNEKNVEAAIALAGGESTGISKGETVKVIRFEGDEKKVEEIENSQTALSEFPIQNGDVIFVPSVVTKGRKFDYAVTKLPGGNVFYPSYEDRVFVLGGVMAPGPYPFSPYYNLNQYITLAGGMSQLSTGKIKITTAEGKRIKYNPKKDVQINPGDTINVGYRRIPPEGRVSLFMGVAGFGLSTTATVLALTNQK